MPDPSTHDDIAEIKRLLEEVRKSSNEIREILLRLPKNADSGQGITASPAPMREI